MQAGDTMVDVELTKALGMPVKVRVTCVRGGRVYVRPLWRPVRYRESMTVAEAAKRFCRLTDEQQEE